MDIQRITKKIYKQFGQSKPMITDEPCYFLQRNFKGEQDLLIIFKTPPCQSCCKYCNLSNQDWHGECNVIEQFAFAIGQMKHSLSVLDRVTLSNNGSVLDSKNIPQSELISILEAVTQIKNISTVVLETNLRFTNHEILDQFTKILGNVRLNILTGFETLDENIMADKLGKKRNKEEFEHQLDILAGCGCCFTAYILYKPDPCMTDEEAYIEAKHSAFYLIDECKKREMKLTLRINPMYAASGTEWAILAKNTPIYSPPKISDVYSLGLELSKYVSTYIGLSTESKDEPWGSYRVHSDFTHKLLLDIIHFNSSI